MWRRVYAGNIACGDPSWVSAGRRDVVPTHPVLLQRIRENEPGAPRRATDIRRVRSGFLMQRGPVGADVDEAALAFTGAPACVTKAHHTLQAAADLRLVNWLCGLIRERHIDFQEHRGRGTKIRAGGTEPAHFGGIRLGPVRADAGACCIERHEIIRRTQFQVHGGAVQLTGNRYRSAVTESTIGKVTRRVWVYGGISEGINPLHHALPFTASHAAVLRNGGAAIVFKTIKDAAVRLAPHLAAGVYRERKTGLKTVFD